MNKNLLTRIFSCNSRFADHLFRHGGDLLELIRNCKEGTILAPSNEAFTPEVEEALADRDMADKILGMHFVQKRIAGDDVRIRHPHTGLSVSKTQ